MARKIELLFSDVSFGTEEFGFIPRLRSFNPDKEDLSYVKYLKSKGVDARVANGYVWL